MSRIALRGFVSPWSGHAHLLKHVLRITETASPRDARDDEQWEQLIPQPPLVLDVERRRESALAVLSRVPGCPAGREGVTSTKPCDRCQDHRAMHVVSHEMAPIFDSYVAAAQSAVDFAFANPDRYGPRLVAFRTERSVKLEAVDARHVRVAAILDGPDTARALTCYRDRTRTLQSWWLELARVRAAHRRAGTLENLG